MKNILFYIFIALQLLVGDISYSQSSLDAVSQRCIDIALKNDLPSIKMRESLPNIPLKFIDYRSGIGNTSDFKGKLVILDFWSQWCGVCIAAFPGMKLLQDKFKDSVLIMPVTYQSKTSVSNFKAVRKRIERPMKLPSIIEDTIMRRFFPHNGEPYEVWINPQGIIIGMTSQYEVSEQTIRAALAGDYSNLRSINRSMDDSETHQRTENAPVDFLYQSFITKYNPTMPEGRLVPINSGNSKILRCRNTPPLLLFHWTLYQKYNNDLFSDKRVLFEGADESLFDNWKPVRDTILDKLNYVQNYYYCYQLKAPVYYPDSVLYTIALNDLEHFFKVKVSVQKRKIRCCLLVRTSDKDKIQTKGYNGTEYVPHPDDDVVLHVNWNNMPISELLVSLNSIKNIPYVIDSTNYTNDIDITFDIPKDSDLTKICAELRKYDLDLVLTEREMNMLIFEPNY
jgi:thiol-disulfide isomerase/thioredoxin